MCMYIYYDIHKKQCFSRGFSPQSLSKLQTKSFSACKLPFIAAASLTMLFQPQQGEISPITRVVPISTYGWNSHNILQPVTTCDYSIYGWIYVT